MGISAAPGNGFAEVGTASREPCDENLRYQN